MAIMTGKTKAINSNRRFSSRISTSSTITITIAITIIAALCFSTTLAFAPIAHTNTHTRTRTRTHTATNTATNTGIVNGITATSSQLHFFKNIFGRGDNNDKDKDEKDEESKNNNVNGNGNDGSATTNADADVDAGEPTDAIVETTTTTNTVSAIKTNSEGTLDDTGAGTGIDTDADATVDTEAIKGETEKLLFFARIANAFTPNTDASSSTSSSTMTSLPKSEETIPVPAAVPVIVTAPETVIPTAPQLTPTEKAQALKAQATRVRLEAEKMDIMLTLDKIDKLEKELVKLQKSMAQNAVDNDAPVVDGEGDSEGGAARRKEKGRKLKQQQEQDIRKQLSALQRKLDVGSGTSGGGDDKKAEGSKSKVAEGSGTGIGTVVPVVPVVPVQEKKDLDAVLSAVVTEKKAFIANQTLTEEEIQMRVEKFNAAPLFMRELVAKAAGMDSAPLSLTSTSDSEFNTTALILQMYQDEKMALSNGYGVVTGSGNTNGNGETKPEFTQEQIDEVLDAISFVPQFVKNMYGDEMKNNDTAIALMMLEEEWQSGKMEVMPEITQKMIDEKLQEFQWVPQFLRGDNDTELAIELIKFDLRGKRKGGGMGKALGVDVNGDVKGDESYSLSKDTDGGSISSADTDTKTSQKGIGGLFGAFNQQQLKSDTDQMVESLFPQSTRKEGTQINEGQAVLFMSEVLSKDKIWTPNRAPEKVSGGFLVRGTTRFETGAELIEAIDKNLEKSRLRNLVNCFYVFDPTPVSEEQMSEGERPPVLFLTAPNVVRDPAPIQRSLISAVAFGTIWYNSLLPYLLNEKYMKMADEQLALADASMASNVDFLNDLAFPLFVATVGIQAVHEIAHVIAASNNGLNVTIPTLVPSLGFGLTGGITSLQNPPKDKQALFDFAIAGPLAGMGASIALLVIGMAATSTMDAATYSSLPELPLNIIRQSSLVGGIIDSFSPGLLTVPDAALGTKALQEINIPLHPFAIAGYFGMMVNAANLLPVGRTDGGRMALTLFGRSGTQLVSFLTFVGMFILGLTGSDLLLFFFSFVVFFQSELEIPQRNEVDDMDFSRVLLATATGVLVLLTLIPM